MTYASKDYIFLKKWKKHQRNLVMTIYPHLPEEEVDKVLEDMIDKSVTVQDATIQNTYVHKTVSDNLLGVLNWVENSKPILAGFGVFFKDHNKAANPAAIMLQNFMDLRNKYKAQLKNHKETSYEYLTFDRLQGSEKVNANSFYGASGALHQTSLIYSLQHQLLQLDNH